MKLGRDPLTLRELQHRFRDEASCISFVERARWLGGPVCPQCGTVDNVTRISTRPGNMVCLECGKTFSVTSGTPMHKTHLPLSTWLIAIYLLTTSSKGISALKLASLLGLQYRTTWHLCHRIRAMMDDDPDLLRGIVELDETFIGGKPRKQNKPQAPEPLPLFDKQEPAKPKEPKKGRHRKGRGAGKPMAFTAVERGGMVRMAPVASHGAVDLLPWIRRWVDRSAVIATDELPAYIAIGRGQAGHIAVNHSADEFAKTDDRTGIRAHVNTAEAVHSVLKRAIVGVWHQISAKHLARYLAETCFHWNQRGAFEGRLSAVFGSRHGPLPLKGLLS